MELATQSIHVEQELLKESVGCQDQVLAAFGGFIRVDFDPDGEIRVSPVVIPADRATELQSHLLLYFTGFSRIASSIAEVQISRIPHLQSELSAMYRMVDEAQSILCSRRDIVDLGRLLHESWMIKRSLNPRIATPAIDDIYSQARAAGAIGGKLMGAGGGGFMVFFVKPDDQMRVRQVLSGLLEVPFRFERSGSQIMLYHPNRYPGPRQRPIQ
jgi:D-glycero-alpha-D-manno-heptose-7-phosphate kinase